MRVITRTQLAMHPVALGVWALFLGVVVAAEWADPLMNETGLWMALVAYFVVFEAIGVLRSRSGDTLSEMFWTITSGKWGARVFAAAFACYFALRLYMLLAPGDWPTFGSWVPRLTLLTGFAIWLVVHLVTEGADG